VFLKFCNERLDCGESRVWLFVEQAAICVKPSQCTFLEKVLEVRSEQLVPQLTAHTEWLLMLMGIHQNGGADAALRFWDEECVIGLEARQEIRFDLSIVAGRLRKASGP
jgi:hypothetical protein